VDRGVFLLGKLGPLRQLGGPVFGDSAHGEQQDSSVADDFLRALGLVVDLDRLTRCGIHDAQRHVQQRTAGRR
jgi:hypothetical protein